MSTSKINIAIFYGGRSAEHEVSILSARSIYKEFNKDKYNIYPVAIDKKGYFHSTAQSSQILKSEEKEVPLVKRNNILAEDILNLLENKVDLVFPVLHGPYGEDGKIQGFLDVLNISYIGCDLISSAVGMDKALMKEIFAFNNLPQSKFIIFNKADYDKNENKTIFKSFKDKLSLPFFIKPANMGSSIGISKINDFNSFEAALLEAFKYDNKLVIETNVEAREIESAVLGTFDSIKVSAAGEIISANDFYDYQAKYEDKKTKLIIPAELPAKIEAKIEELSRKAFKAIGAEGLSRLDFFVDEKKDLVLINEINTMPGFTNFSMYPLLFKEIGISYSKLLDELVEIALKKAK